MIILGLMVFILAFAMAFCFIYCLSKILVEEEDRPHGKYAVLYNAFTDTYSEPYVRYEWLHYQRYRAVRWKYILGTIVCFFGTFGFGYIAHIILN